MGLQCREKRRVSVVILLFNVLRRIEVEDSEVADSARLGRLAGRIQGCIDRPCAISLGDGEGLVVGTMLEQGRERCHSPGSCRHNQQRGHPYLPALPFQQAGVDGHELEQELPNRRAIVALDGRPELVVYLVNAVVCSGCLGGNRLFHGVGEESGWA